MAHTHTQTHTKASTTAKIMLPWTPSFHDHAIINSGKPRELFSRTTWEGSGMHHGSKGSKLQER